MGGGGEFVFYFPLIRRTIYMRFWKDEISSTNRELKHHKKRTYVYYQQRHQIKLNSVSGEQFDWKSKRKAKKMLNRSEIKK